jgi:methionyl-tRNA formyltransferase
MSNMRPRVLFFGMEGMFSATVLKGLLVHEVEICALVLPASPLMGKAAPPIRRSEAPPNRRTPLPLLSATPSLLQLAWNHQLPVWEVRKLSASETFNTLAAYQADLLCVACFSQRLPHALLDLPRLEALNVHPSLLPANRGPVPLFWTFREGHSVTGVTIHALEDTLDSGDIFAQVQLPVPDGISYHELEMQAAERGGELLAQTIFELFRGKATRTPQDESRKSYHSFPEPEDFLVYTEQWEARRVYNFIQGVGLWSGPVMLQAGADRFPVIRATSYSTQDVIEPSPKGEAVIHRDGQTWVRSLDGWVQVSPVPLYN